jgi:HEAT repeat protein
MEGDEEARRAAAEQLAALGPQAAEALGPLMQAMGDPNADVRAGVAQVLGQIGPQAMDAVPVLIQALGDQSPAVPPVAAGALKGITGQDFGLDANAWQQWWQGQG